MRAYILAVGSELLGPDRLDTNSLRLTEVLERAGAELLGKQVVADSVADISSAVKRAIETADLVLVTGGLGPTSDDLTREGVARALGRAMHESVALVEDIRRKFRRLELDMPEVNRRQAQVIEGAEILPNRRGTAPGLRLEEGEATLFLLPGVPVELEAMIELYLEPWLEKRRGDREAVASRSLRVACRSESGVEEALGPLYAKFGGEAITILASPGDIEVRLRALGAGSAGERLDAMETEARRLLGDSVYAEGRDATLEGAVGELLSRHGRSVATAESCTGGGIAERITSVAGSSAYFLGGVVVYSDASKRDLLGIPEEMLQRNGAVSEAVAVAMARGVRHLLEADFGIGITGIAGPGGGRADKPVGTVHLALATPRRGDGVLHRRLSLPGDRHRVRRLAGQWALDLLRRDLSGGTGR
ncbi:MAG: competence/damage-inducible protein A [Thermoanaerobaculia bacterium]|nr:competence/damage-inducible protein A [Thermoanaerobaculia bacterium]